MERSYDQTFHWDRLVNGDYLLYSHDTIIYLRPVIWRSQQGPNIGDASLTTISHIYSYLLNPIMHLMDNHGRWALCGLSMAAYRSAEDVTRGVTEYSVYYSSELQLLLVQCGYRFTDLIGKCSLSSFPFAAQLEVQW